MRPKIDKLIAIAYHWLSPLLILYLPMQKVNGVDNQLVNVFEAQIGRKILINSDKR